LRSHKYLPDTTSLKNVKALLHFEGYHIDNDNDGSYTLTSLDTVSVADYVFSLLEELHKPMHYKEITSKLQERNIHVPGKNLAATLLSRINRDKRFKRGKNRGEYILSTWRMRKTRVKTRKRKSNPTLYKET